MAARNSLAKPALIAVAAALAIALVGGMLTDPGPWFQTLRKPPWQPPGWLFAPAWAVIFVLATVAAVDAWRSADNAVQRRWVIVLFAVNGGLNILWSALFFALKRPDWALLEVVCLWLSILLPIAMFWRFARIASVCLVPYLSWVSFAAVLNLTVVRLNAPFA